jgi:hypothetical protein
MAIQKERRATPRKPAAKGEQKAPAATPAPESRSSMSSEDIKRLIEETAYFKAKERGFTPGYELEDWVQAEAEIKRRLARAP